MSLGLVGSPLVTTWPVDAYFANCRIVAVAGGFLVIVPQSNSNNETIYSGYAQWFSVSSTSVQPGAAGQQNLPPNRRLLQAVAGVVNGSPVVFVLATMRGVVPPGRSSSGTDYGIPHLLTLTPDGVVLSDIQLLPFNTDPIASGAVPDPLRVTFPGVPSNWGIGGHDVIDMVAHPGGVLLIGIEHRPEDTTNVDYVRQAVSTGAAPSSWALVGTSSRLAGTYLGRVPGEQAGARAVEITSAATGYFDTSDTALLKRTSSVELQQGGQEFYQFYRTARGTTGVVDARVPDVAFPGSTVQQVHLERTTWAGTVDVVTLGNPLQDGGLTPTSLSAAGVTVQQASVGNVDTAQQAYTVLTVMNPNTLFTYLLEVDLISLQVVDAIALTNPTTGSYTNYLSGRFASTEDSLGYLWVQPGRTANGVATLPLQLVRRDLHAWYKGGAETSSVSESQAVVVIPLAPVPVLDLGPRVSGAYFS